MIDKPLKELTFIDLNELLYGNKLVESQTIELKSGLAQDNGKLDGREFVKDVTAFANSNGGYLILGIDEKNQEICGLSSVVGNQKISDWISNVVNDLVDKTVKFELTHISISEDDSSCVMVIHVPEGLDKPYYVLNDKKPIPYIRKGTSIFAAKPSDIKEMYLSKSPAANDIPISIKQQAKGKNISQIAVNNGTIISTEKITNKNEVIAHPDLHINEQQAKEIKDIIDNIVEINEKSGRVKVKSDKGKLYKDAWQSLYNRFGVTSYKLVDKDKFDEVVQWLNQQIAIKHRPKLRRTDNIEWRNQHYTGIYSRSRNELSMDKDQLYKLAFERLGLKKPIESLKELNDTHLKKLYSIIFSK
jgi:hypothetical protein